MGQAWDLTNDHCFIVTPQDLRGIHGGSGTASNYGGGINRVRRGHRNSGDSRWVIFSLWDSCLAMGIRKCWESGIYNKY